MINKQVENKTLLRLRKVEGQIKGIQKMIEQRRYCIDVVMQITAAESALSTIAEIILRNHLETCVKDAFMSKDTQKRERKISELMKVYRNLRKH